MNKLSLVSCLAILFFIVSCARAPVIRTSWMLTPHRTIHQIWGKVSNIYIIVDTVTDATYLVDCGMLGDTEAIENALRQNPPLRRIVCTHFHIDHIRSWKRLSKIFPETEIWFYDEARRFVDGLDRVACPSYKGLTKGMIPVMEEYGYGPPLGELLGGCFYGTPYKKGFPKGRVVFFADNQDVLPGFRVIPTPGHTPDSVSFFDPDSGILITGDFLIVIKGELVVNPYAADPLAQQNSWQMIQGMPGIRFIYPGHGICRRYP